MNKNLKIILLFFLWFPSILMAQVDYSVVYVNEEAGTTFTRITSENDYVCMPEVKRSRNSCSWYSNRIIDVSKDGTQIAYLSARNNTTNIFIKDIGKQGGSVQRTNRQAVLDFSYSPDGQNICFSEKSGKINQIYQTSATTGYVCRQLTNNNKDYSPVYSPDMKNVFFARQENNGVSIWSYNITDNYLSNYTKGMNPCPMLTENSLLCSRANAEGRWEIWRINYATGIEECILTDPVRSFTTPSISPDGEWFLLVGSSLIPRGKGNYANTDIYVCRTDGSQLLQLTYHAADDLSPVWSKDGNWIYFISQRGSSEGTANIWRMNFVHQ